ncbi:MAG: mannitol dehydrogenase family protein [Pseudomonas oryzihabitans]|uniref:mannitol dehydrogenase family protein n=1 Tax=Pseudomonas oryzihabitans TaxID=47885 RepID=UPI00290F3176|nr:mannitol dehydrogenase family protein [Pseudomonas oryzihabitans]MDU4055415.1 mannitol dehydrogenase family protein [Pseudomonas oryzihabitans]
MSDFERIPSRYPAPAIGIVHLGLGAFHRAHQAVYLERNLARHGGGAWGLCSANLRSGRALVETLSAQEGRYHVAEYRNRREGVLREIGVLREVLYAGDGGAGREALLARLADPGVRIVTLTVTEKGYCLSPASGALRRDDPGIVHDLTEPRAPRTAPGLLVEGLRRRRAAGIAPFTVLCCDNMPDNGQRTRQAVVSLAEAQDAGLAAWIATEVAFPCSMVDRIVPAMDEAAFARLRDLGFDDPAAVVGEAFSQWVVEDRFPQGRPDWEHEGVQMVADVRPFETMKLRLLNGSHSLLAYVGSLAGHGTVAEAMADERLAALVHRYMSREAAPTLDMPEGVDLPGYAQALVARFRNDALQHRLRQIAMDGSQKLPQRWLLGARQLLEQGGDPACTALGVAAWIHYGEGEGEALDDPLRATLAALPTGAARVDAVLALAEVFPPDLAAHPVFHAAVQSAHARIATAGIEAAIADLTEQGV